MPALPAEAAAPHPHPPPHPPAAGGVELGKPEYSGGVRQELHRVAEHLKQGDIEIHQGRVEDYVGSMMRSR
jgi:hypothetical protein